MAIRPQLISRVAAIRPQFDGTIAIVPYKVMEAAMQKIPLIVIVGPTATGKTALGVELAKLFCGNAEIVSGDSMQLYKGMDIATANPTQEELQGIPHHLISLFDADKSFSVAEYVTLAKAAIENIHRRGKQPILVGGTGLYINSVIDNITFTPSASCPELRARLTQKAAEQGRQVLLSELREFDPETANSLHPNNLGRIIRAIEIYRLEGVPMSAQKRHSRESESPFDVTMIGLNFRDRQLLYDRINRRVDRMLRDGLLEEAAALRKKPLSKTASQAIGHKELEPYFEGAASLEEVVEKLKQSTRNYAKRQLTWFMRDERINWIYLDNTNSIKEVSDITKTILEKTGKYDKLVPGRDDASQNI